jgi:hypothetical protein
MTKKNFSDDVLERVGSQINIPLTDETRDELTDVAWEWFQTSEAVIEPRRKEFLGEELSVYLEDRVKHYTAIFERSPRKWYVADCDLCEWAMGGWMTSAHALMVLKSHQEEKH